MSNGQIYAYDKIVSWIREKIQKSGLNGITIGISGGIDSAVSAVLAIGAIGKEKVDGLILPYYDDKHFKDALDVAGSFDIHRSTIWINDIYDSYYHTGLLWKDITKENTMARIRMTLLRAYANEHNMLLVGTGNMSEAMVGYCTKGGDDEADIFPIIRLMKYQVYELARYINQLANLNGPIPHIPEEIINKEPSAGLYPNQTDKNDLDMNYETLDKLIIQHKWGIHANASNKETLRFKELFNGSEHKRCGIQFPELNNHPDFWK